jgi:hypothetical protein
MARKRNGKARYSQVKAARDLSDDEISVEVTGDEEEMQDIFSEDRQQPLTDELIDELVTVQGWDRKGLEDFRRQGGRYHRGRNSIFMPAETIGNVTEWTHD